MSVDDRIGPLRAADPTELGPYRLLGVIGRGGMGTVYLAESASGERMAVKVINLDFADDPAFRVRFRREVAAARRVRRFCTAPVLDARVDGEPLYIVTEYVAGPNLDEFVRDSGPMSGSSLEHLAVGVATALGAIHGAGIVHRDLKPANVLLSPMGPRVIDFGIARALDSVTEATRPGQLIGTPAYMAPEVIQGERATTASDVFAWGAVVAFAGTGSAPFPGATVPAVLYRITHGSPLLDGLDDAVRPLVERALDKDPARRPSAQELLAGLVGHARSGRAEPETDVGTQERSVPAGPMTESGLAGTLVADTASPEPVDQRKAKRRPSRVRRLVWIGVVAATAAATVGSIVALRSPSRDVTTTIYTSEFNAEARTWDVDKNTSYVGGRYRMRAEGRVGNDSKPAPFPSADLPARMKVDADVAVVSGPGDGMMGLWCRGPDYRILDGYVFLVRNDGQGAFIRKVTAGGSRTLAQVPRATGYDIDADADAAAGPPRANHFAIRCEPDGAKVRLRLWLNGRLTVEAVDAQDTLQGGQTGLVVVVGTQPRAGRMVVDFDDYRISRVTTVG
ncbi:serine/threonine protein kinase [Actinoallomurus purpureus]|uniref:serine/threonine-protein kinase n=1 Tax=Actinoallomurus purpureus TaxID=478114 RepID=UPI00209385B8|nr:serine/threonine-protein kinase [Actinoallomurus purpureus]MCO6009504.1 serine/threonine protein kinase [Actinoallomurus purpureus]